MCGYLLLCVLTPKQISLFIKFLVNFLFFTGQKLLLLYLLFTATPEVENYD